MGSRLLVPFDYNPAAVSVRTTSYTIPAGRYARVTVSVEGSSTFTIGGAVALRGTQNNVLANLNLNSDSNVTGRLNVGTTASNGSSLSTSVSDQKPLVADYFLPSGTVINGTGTWRAVVQEYNVIS